MNKKDIIIFSIGILIIIVACIIGFFSFTYHPDCFSTVDLTISISVCFILVVIPLASLGLWLTIGQFIA